MNNKTLILCLLRGDEITYGSCYARLSTTKHTSARNTILNKWSIVNHAKEIPIETFHSLLRNGIIELSSSNFENGEEHFQMIRNDSMLKTLNECILRSIQSDFETTFMDILLKYERKMKLIEINRKI